MSLGRFDRADGISLSEYTRGHKQMARMTYGGKQEDLSVITLGKQRFKLKITIRVMIHI